MADVQISHNVVVVTGDATMDWNLARTRRSRGDTSAWGFDDCTRACWQRGGAALLADLIEAVADSLRQSGQANFVLRQMAAPREPVHPGDDRYRHSYAMWSPFKSDERSPDEPPAWRVEEFLGHDHCPTDAPPESEEWKRVVDDTPEAGLVVLDDAGLGFRDRDDLWPQAITAEGCRPWILVKMAAPVAQGTLWEELHRNHADRLVVVITVNDLRRTEVQISRELSWERTAQDLFWELVHNPRINALSHCAHAVISFGPAGAVLLSRAPIEQDDEAEKHVTRKCFLFFDPQVIEGMWEQGHPGGMIGYNTCLTAAIARQLMLSPDQPNIHQGIQSGLVAMRTLHLKGYGERGATAERAQLVFPIERIAGELASDVAPFATVEVQDPLRFLTQPQVEGQKGPEAGLWTILEDRYSDNLNEVAEQIVLEGADVALQGVPLGQFGNMLTVNRREIESFRSIRAMVGEYCRQGRQKCPLSIAVFGAPGSGKSFGIIQVAKSLLPGQIEVLEFNLSQFGSADDLLAALHQAQDAGLSGQIPLVFWDEFDTPLAGKPLGWLCYFLTPLQDGRFQERQISHPIGRSIFVFAGGTSERMEDFGQGLAPEEFRAAKGPDFISRLKGYVNIRGPNRQKDVQTTSSDADLYYVIRRAILLRSILQRNSPQLFEGPGGKGKLSIDPGVLRAFLQTREYKHGIRSVEAIVAMSLLTGKTAYERSSLPAEAQLDLHVDGRGFLALVRQMDLEGDLLEKLAEAAHEVYCEGLKDRGYRWGPQTDGERKISSALVPYVDLPEDLKGQNRSNVRDIANKLARIGYVMIPARSNEPPFGFPGDDLEKLAAMEHDRWMKTKLEAGWRYGPKTDKDKKLNEALLPWDQLPENQKEKDRELVRGIPKILARAGYAIVKSRSEATKP
jgi:hypothetical protein